jgi:hypothetical protein
MARNAKSKGKGKAKVDLREKITVQLDSRTTIIVRSREAVQSWLVRYPNAKVVN